MSEEDIGFGWLDSPTLEGQFADILQSLKGLEADMEAELLEQDSSESEIQQDLSALIHYDDTPIDAIEHSAQQNESEITSVQPNRPANRSVRERLMNSINKHIYKNLQYLFSTHDEAADENLMLAMTSSEAIPPIDSHSSVVNLSSTCAAQPIPPALTTRVTPLQLNGEFTSSTSSHENCATVSPALVTPNVTRFFNFQIQSNTDPE